jgi:hypothetical protein
MIRDKVSEKHWATAVAALRAQVRSFDPGVADAYASDREAVGVIHERTLELVASTAAGDDMGSFKALLNIAEAALWAVASGVARDEAKMIEMAAQHSDCPKEA